jgi:hypothetical protein
MDLGTPFSNFSKNINSVEELLNLYDEISKETNLYQNKDEILRAVIVLVVSALDNFLHDFYRSEIVDSYLNEGKFNINFEKLKISINGMKSIDESKSTEEKRNILINELRNIQKTDSYQSPKSVEYIFDTLNIDKIWTKLENQGIQNLKASDIKSELSNIIDRRNKISHESDWDYINEKKYPITSESVKSVINFVKSFVIGINKLKLAS